MLIINQVHGLTNLTDSPSESESSQTTLDGMLKKSINISHLRKLFVKLVVHLRLSYTTTQVSQLHTIIEYLDPRAEVALVSANTLKADCRQYYQQAKNTIAEILSTARSSIHISFDL